MIPFCDVWQHHIKGIVGGQQFIDKFVNISDVDGIGRSFSNLAVVVVEGFQVLEYFHRLSCEAEVKSTQQTHITVVLIFDELNNNFFVRLDLEQLEDQAHKWCGLLVSSVGSAKVFKLHGFVHQRFSG